MNSDRILRSANSHGPAIAVGIASLVILAIGLKGFYQNHQFYRKELRSQAIIEAYWTTTGSKGTGYPVRYHFVDESFRQWNVSDFVAQGTYAHVQGRNMVWVKYLEGDPAASRVDWPDEAQAYWGAVEITLSMGLVFEFLAVLIYFFGLRQR